MNKRTNFATALVVTASLLAACGGGSDAPAATDAVDDDDVVETISSEPPATDPPVTEPPETNPPATDPPVTEPPATDPPATDPPVTEPPATEPPNAGLPEWASGEMVTVESDTGPLELPVELAPFCESSRSFYVAANGLEFLAEGQTGTVQQLFAAMAALAPLTIETAPSEDFAEEPTAVLGHLGVIIPAFEAVGYDGNRLSESADPNAVLESLQGFQEIVTSLRSFLTDVCGADEAVLDEQSENAVDIAAEAVGESIEPEAPVEAVPGTEISNGASTIMLEVPTDWTQTDETPINERDVLVAAPDMSAFSELEGPGVLVLRGLGGFRDGGFVGRVLEFESDLEEAGCVATDERDYDDGVYVGQQRIYDCGIDGLDVRLLGGTEADGELYAMVFVVHPSDELGILDLIIATFEVA